MIGDRAVPNPVPNRGDSGGMAPNRSLMGAPPTTISFASTVRRAIPFATAQSWGGASARRKQISSFAADGMIVWTGKDMLGAAEVRDRIARIICRAQRLPGRVRCRRRPCPRVPDSVINESRAL